MTADLEFDAAYAAEQLRRSRHPLRRLIKRFYLDHVLHDVHGPTIDLGCGAGQWLARLPAGSVGVEVNPVLVEHLRSAGMNVLGYDAAGDGFALTGLRENHYKTLVISHVLEHFDDAASVIRALWRSCARLGIETIVAIVPGAKGYASDATHKTFVDVKFIEGQGLRRVEGFELTKLRYFPIDHAVVGDYFTFHELKLVYKAVR
jgi:2-polyprenyl-3-methyl-5-hydroxy-6-metoxy-1,4-benzoquinol methylase